MILWSILTEKAWQQLQRNGRLRAERRHLIKEYLGSYRWMAEQMIRRLPVSRPSHDTMPLWAWYQWEGKRKKPDLRTGGHLPTGDRGVRIEFLLEDNEVLLSDFDLWHYVLNYWYLPTSEREGRSFEKKLAAKGLSFYQCNHERPLPHAQYRKEIEQSWERIFDIDWCDRSHAIADPPEKKSIQATFWELRLKDVSEFTMFTAR
jgi:hypothetical protein